MRPLDQLIDESDPGFPLLKEWISQSSVPCEILPPSSKRESVLLGLQVTTRSMLGTIAYETGGVFVDGGWLRLIGSGSEELQRDIHSWNEERSSGFLLVADDAVGEKLVRTPTRIRNGCPFYRALNNRELTLTTLVIVGNGFDIQNGLPTSYSYFYKKYSSQLDKYFVYFPDFIEDQEWSNFEENLGNFDEDSFREKEAWEPSMDDMVESPKYANGYNDEISQKVDELVGDIENAFTTWIRGIDTKKATKFMDFPAGCKFINFNYTSTLQDVYSAPEEDVLHIHGKSQSNVIFGHGFGNSNQSSPMEPDHDEPWFEEAYQSLASVTDKFHKPVDKILNEHRSHLEKYGDITKIVVLGHSINDIDAPYFKYILQAYPDAIWRNWNHKSEEYDGISDTHKKLLSIGVPSEKLYSMSSKKLGRAYPIILELTSGP